MKKILQIKIVCTNIKVILDETPEKASWSYGSCSESHDGRPRKSYEKTCCLAARSHILTCRSFSGLGWKHGHIKIGDKIFCDDFEKSRQYYPRAFINQCSC